MIHLVLLRHLQFDGDLFLVHVFVRHPGRGGGWMGPDNTFKGESQMGRNF